MTSESVQVFRQTDVKQKEPSRLLGNRDCLLEREKPPQKNDESKTVRKLKCVKEYQDCKKSIKDAKYENIFLNSEFFKHQSNNIPSLSFCSGDKGEYRWTVESNFEIPSQPKNFKNNLLLGDSIKNLTSNNFPAKEKNFPTKFIEKSKLHHAGSTKESPDNKPEKFIESIQSGNEKMEKDLVALVTEQMFLAEKELQITRLHLNETISKLNEKNLEIIGLHEKVQNLQKLKKGKQETDGQDSSNKTLEDYQKLISASEKLKKQVKDMEEFLNDYGLVWVGDRETDGKPDFNKIIKNFQRLNSIASQPKIIQTNLGAKFEVPKGISVVLYANGILLKGNDFKEYNKVGTNLFLQDLEDGYFPSELQSEYPEGVPFEVTDKRKEIYDGDGKFNVFTGSGNRLGSKFEDKPPSIVFLKPVKESKSRSSSPNCSVEFSNKFTAKKNQKKIAKTLQEKPKNYYSCDENGGWGKDSYDDPAPDFKESTSKQLTLKIRFGKGKTELFTMEINESDRVSNFYECLRNKLCERYHNECLSDVNSNDSQTDFEVHIYGKKPFRLLDNLYKRLDDCGISNNCVLNVWEI